MKRVLIINVSCNTGSTGRIAEQIGQTAINQGFDVYYAYGRKGNPSKCHTIPIGTDLDVKIHALESRLFDNHGFSSYCATKKLIQDIDNLKPDVINLHNVHGYYLNVQVLFEYLSNKNIPVVWTLHDCWPFTGHCAFFDRYHCEKWKTGCYHCPNKNLYPISWLLDRSKHNYKKKKELFNSVKDITFVPVCHWMEDNLKNSFLGNYPSSTIYNGLDINVFQPQNTESIRTKLGIDKSLKVIIGVASVWDKRKGLDDFLRLRFMLNNEYIIVLVGLTEKQIETLPSGIIGVRRTESVRELSELYSLADVFVNPTYVDNFPTTNIEALACGTPVITYKTGGSPEAVDEETGLVANQGDISQLSDYIRYIANRKAEYSTKCRERAVSFYNKHDRFNDYVKLFDELTKK